MRLWRRLATGVVVLVVVLAGVATYGRLWEVMVWVAQGKQLRDELTSCPAAAQVAPTPLPPGGVEVFSALTPVYPAGAQRPRYYPGYKMCSAVVARSNGRRYVIAFAEARTKVHDGYDSVGKLPNPPKPGSCDDRTHHAVVMRISADDGRTWSRAQLVTPLNEKGSYSDVVAGVHKARGELVVLMVYGHRRYRTCSLKLSELGEVSGDADGAVLVLPKFSKIVDISTKVHPAHMPDRSKTEDDDHIDGECRTHKKRGGCDYPAFRARCPVACRNQTIVDETYCNTGHTSAVYDAEAADLIFPASLGGENKGAFLIVCGRSEWSMRGHTLLQPGRGFRHMEPAIAVDPAMGQLVANCRDFQQLNAGTWYSGNRRLEFYSSDMGHTWETDASGSLSATRTNLVESWLTMGSTAGVAADGQALYYLGNSHGLTRQNLALFRRRPRAGASYEKVRSIYDGPTMTQNLLADEGAIVGALFEQGELSRPMFGIVFQAVRVVYVDLRHLNAKATLRGGGPGG